MSFPINRRKQRGFLRMALKAAIADQRPLFALPLQTGQIPAHANGSSTLTKTRATTAYVFDWENLAKLCLSGEMRCTGARRIYNAAVKSDDLTAWSNLGNATRTASSLTEDNANAQHYVGNTVGPIAAGNTAWLTVEVKQSVGTRNVVVGCGTMYVIFNPSTGAVVTTSGSPPDYFAVNSATSDGYWKVGVKVTVNGALYYIQLASGSSVSYSGDAASTVLIRKFQYEDVTGQSNVNPGEFVSSGVLSAPFNGASVDGVKYFSTLNGNAVSAHVLTEASGLTINPTNGASAVTTDANGPLGYQAELAAADLLGTTAAIRRTMTDVGWVGSNMTVGSATGIDGGASAAASLTATAGNATILFTTVLGAAVRTFDARVRRKNGTGPINITGDNGSTWTVIVLTSAYQDFKFTTASAANPVVGFRIVTSADAIEVDLNTLIAGSNASPTPVPLNVSRAIDVLTLPSAENIYSESGTIICEATQAGANSNFHIFSSSSNGQIDFLSTDKLSAYDGIGADKTLSAALGAPFSTPKKCAVAWGGSTFVGKVDLTDAVVASFDGGMDWPVNVGIGATASSATAGTSALQGTIRFLRGYRRKLSLRALTQKLAG